MAFVTCPKCAQIRESHLRYCRSCGAASPGPSETDPVQLEGVRCPTCARYAGAYAAFCPHCGARLAGAPAGLPRVAGLASYAVSIEPRRRSSIHQVFRLLFTIWLVGYPVIACGPVLLGAASGGASGSAVAVGGIVVGWVTLLPWLYRPPGAWSPCRPDPLASAAGRAIDVDILGELRTTGEARTMATRQGGGLLFAKSDAPRSRRWCDGLRTKRRERRHERGRDHGRDLDADARREVLAAPGVECREGDRGRRPRCCHRACGKRRGTTRPSRPGCRRLRRLRPRTPPARA